MKTQNRPIPCVQSASSPSEIQAIQRLRYEVYAAEMSMDLPGMDHKTRSFGDALDWPVVHLFAEVEGQVVGAVRLNTNAVPRGLEKPLEVDFLPRPFIYCSRLNVLPRWRGTGVTEALIGAAFLSFRKQGAASVICHCYPHLLNLYRRHGFRPYAQRFVYPGLEDHGEQIPLRLFLREDRFVQVA